MTAAYSGAQQTNHPSSLRGLLNILFKHQAKIFIIFAVTVLIVVTGSLFITPMYEATASLLVKIGREYITTSEVGRTSSNVMVVNQEEIISSEIAILNNREVIEKVIAAMGVGTIYPARPATPPAKPLSMDAAIARFAAGLTVQGVKRSNVIDVSFQHPDPVIAARALTLLIDFFKEKHLAIFSNPQSSLLDQQLAEYRQRLKESEDALEAFKQQNLVYAVPEQRTLLLKQQIELDTALQNSKSRIQELQKKAASTREQLRDMAQSTTRYTQTSRDGVIVGAQTRLLELQLKEQELLDKDFRADGRLVGNVRRDITLVKNFLQTQEDAINRKVRTSNPVYQEVETEMLKAEADLASQQAGATTLAQQLAQLDNKIQAIDQKENDLRGLQRSVTINEKNYLTYVEKFEEARISEDLNRQKIANISVIQAPATPQRPLPSKRFVRILLGVVFGALAGLAYAFILELASQSLSTPEQVERRLHIPVLASIALKQAQTGVHRAS